FEYNGADGLTVGNLKIDSQANESQLMLNQVEGGTFDDIDVRGNGTGTAFHLNQCRNLFLSKLSARDLPTTLHMEACANIQYSGLMAIGKDGDAVTPTIAGKEFLTK